MRIGVAPPSPRLRPAPIDRLTGPTPSDDDVDTRDTVTPDYDQQPTLRSAMSSALVVDLLILVAVAIPVVAVFHRLRVPTVVGFLITGLLVGPNGLAFIEQSDEVSGLAHLGAALLLFTIGLELSLSRIIRMARVVFRTGGFQFVGTTFVASVLLMSANFESRTAILLGAMVALSSTAIVLRSYQDRGELDTPHGRIAVSVLLFQDLAAVPLLVLMPILGTGETGTAFGANVTRLLTGFLAVAVLVVAGRWVVPWALDRIVGLRNRELFTLCIGFFGLSAAFVTSSLGLSIEIGAFMAGLVISESEYGLQAMSDVIPFRDAFGGIFFMSVGMLLDLEFIARGAGPILLLASGIFVVKTIVATVVVRLFERSWEVSLVTGLGLAQVGEFSLIVAAAAPVGLLPPETYQLFLGASVLSMMTAPFVIAGAPRLAEFTVSRTGLGARDRPVTDDTDRMRDHAIIVGYGIGGRLLARVLKAEGFPYIILEQNGHVVRNAREAGESIYFGNGTRADVLEHVGFGRARVLVFSIASPSDELRGVRVAHHLNPNAHIIVRTRYVRAIPDLLKAGASDVVVEEFEASLVLFSKVLERYDIPFIDAHEEVEALRREHYEILRRSKTSGENERVES